MSDWVKPDMDKEDILATAINRLFSDAEEWRWLMAEREKLKAMESRCRDNAAAEAAILEQFGFTINPGLIDCHGQTPVRLAAEVRDWFHEVGMDVANKEVGL